MKTIQTMLTAVLMLWPSIQTSISAQPNFWEPVNNGLYGGVINQVLLNSQDHLYALASGKLFRSTNSGQDYLELTSPDLPFFSNLAIDKSDNLYSIGIGVIFQSKDAGLTWDSLHLDVGFATIVPDSRDSIFVFDAWSTSSNYGISVSSDHGQTWRHIGGNIFTGQNTLTFQLFNVSPLDTFFIAEIDHVNGRTVIHRSSDYCQQWKTGQDSIPAMITRLAYNSSGNLFATTYGQGIFRSTDQGNTWTQINNGLTAFSFYSIHVDQSDRIIAGSWRGGVFISTNNGDSWTYANAPNTAFWSGASNSNDEIFLGSDGEGVFFSPDIGANWELRNNNLAAVDVRSMDIDDQNNIYIGTWNGGLFKSQDGGTLWSSTGLEQNLIYSLNADNIDSLFAGDDNIYISTDTANTWDFEAGGEFDLVQDMVTDTGGTYYAATQQGVFYRDNSSGTWNPISDGLPGTNIVDLMVDQNNTIFCNVWGTGIYQKSDGSNNWVSAMGNLPDGPPHLIGWVQSMAIDSASNIYVLLSGQIDHVNPDSTAGIFMSDNQGNHWSSINDPSWSGRISGSIYINKNNVKILSISINYGLAETLIQNPINQRWIDVGSGLSSSFSPVLKTDSEGFIYSGTQCGVFKSALSQSVGQQLMVTNTNDTGPGSLRQAIFDLNQLQNFSVQNDIIFDLDTITDPGCNGGNCTIVLASPLPTIKKNVFIDGETFIAIDGSSLGGNPVFNMGENSDGSLIEGLTFNQPVINSRDLTLENVILNGEFSHENGTLILINVTIDPTN